jgi:hypothetical protein
LELRFWRLAAVTGGSVSAPDFRDGEVIDR